MQSNGNNEFLGARCLPGWVRVVKATRKLPFVSAGYNCMRAGAGCLEIILSYPADTKSSFPIRRIQRCPSFVICIKRILVL
jgi:hypothetical protein